MEDKDMDRYSMRSKPVVTISPRSLDKYLKEHLDFRVVNALFEHQKLALKHLYNKFQYYRG